MQKKVKFENIFMIVIIVLILLTILYWLFISIKHNIRENFLCKKQDNIIYRGTENETCFNTSDIFTDSKYTWIDSGKNRTAYILREPIVHNNKIFRYIWDDGLLYENTGSNSSVSPFSIDDIIQNNIPEKNNMQPSYNPVSENNMQTTYEPVSENNMKTTYEPDLLGIRSFQNNPNTYSSMIANMRKFNINPDVTKKQVISNSLMTNHMTTTYKSITTPMPTTYRSMTTTPMPTTYRSMTTTPMPTTYGSMRTTPMPTTYSSMTTTPMSS